MSQFSLSPTPSACRSLQEKLRFILSATYQHGRNLALFTALYKVLSATLEAATGRAVPAIAGAVCGCLVFGTNNKINMQVCLTTLPELGLHLSIQINLYLLSRVTLALVKLAHSHGWIPAPPLPAFSLFAALVWGLVMWLYEAHLTLLQPSLQVCQCVGLLH